MTDHKDERTHTEQCRYLRAAYPDLDADDTCSEHQHNAPTFALARAMAEVWQQPDPTDEQIGWLMDDAAAVVEDFDPAPLSWTVTETRFTREEGLDWLFDVNGVEYVIQTNDSGGHVVVHPVSRTQWDEWMDEDEGDSEDDCQHEWELRSEHDLWVCAWCQAEVTSPPEGKTS